MIIYKTTSSDTFEKVAKKLYGSEKDVRRIIQANPGVVEPLQIGTELIIPAFLRDSKNQLREAANVNEVAISIEGIRFRFWDSMRVLHAIDNISIVEFSAPLDLMLGNFRDTFQPFSYKSVEVTVGGVRVFTGTMVGVNPILESDRKDLSISCYSLPGVLNDCTAPETMFDSLEFKDQGLRDIVKALVSPFDVGVSFSDDQGAVFDPQVAIAPDRKILSFLIDLAKQRNLVISNDLDGNLLIQKPLSSGIPVANLEQGQSPLISVIPFFNAQEYYSHVTGRQPVSIGSSGSKFTVKNPRLPGVIRPLVFDSTDTEGVSLKQSVQAKVGRMFGSLVSYSLDLATWRDSNGNLWEPNTIVSLLAPDGMVYNAFNFLVRSVEFKKSQEAETATLNIVLPESFGDKIPDGLPWDL